MNMKPLKIKRALLSVSDKTGLVEFAKTLQDKGVEIVATGGTAKALVAAGINIISVSDLTQFPEMMEGRVKTLHPKIHGALLGKRDQHASDAKNHGIDWIDLVVCNLYPFVQTVAQSVELAPAIENIDVGGPTMIRAAAKNFEWVAVAIEPADYDVIITQLETGIDFETRRSLAAKAFAHTSAYDAHITQYLNTVNFPTEKVLAFKLYQSLRYGENPHQTAAWYVSDANPFDTQLQGKTLSFNNIADASAALSCLSEFTNPACVVVKHANPCGVATATQIDLAFQNAWHSDSQSAFGGIVALNRPCTVDIAEFLSQAFIEIIIAPDFTAAALKVLQRKPNYRLLKLKQFPPKLDAFVYKQVLGGMLIQSRDTQILKPETLQVVTEQKPTALQLQEMLFSWQVLKHIKSNGILITKDHTTVGIGAGQVSRIDAVALAIEKAKGKLKDCVLASDGFFPFADSVELIAKTPIKVIIQPGGSIRDAEVIAACNVHGIAMVFTGGRCFTH